MRLRSGEITTANEAITRRKYVREMVNLPSNNGETTIVISASEEIPSMVSTTATVLNTHIGLILSPVRTRGQQLTLV